MRTAATGTQRRSRPACASTRWTTESDRDLRDGVLQPDEDGRCRLGIDGEPLPVLYTLIAARS